MVNRKCRHSQCRFHVALPDPEQLPPFDALIVNASSFRGQAKSTVSPLFHESAAHLLWTAGALATCQPTWASLELPSHLKDMQGGDVWRALEALFDASGYLLHLQRACASWWQRRNYDALVAGKRGRYTTGTQVRNKDEKKTLGSVPNHMQRGPTRC